jgi:hypothetical protein
MLAIFPSPNYSRLGRVSLVTTPAGDGKLANLFLQCTSNKKRRRTKRVGKEIAKNRWVTWGDGDESQHRRQQKCGILHLFSRAKEVPLLVDFLYKLIIAPLPGLKTSGHVAVKKRGIFLSGKAKDIFRRNNDFEKSIRFHRITVWETQGLL